MKSGRYAICLSADGYEELGELQFEGQQGHGHDGKYRFDLQVHEEGSRGAATINLQMDPEVLQNRSLPERFSLSVTGSVEDSTFNLIGVGPFGLIVTLRGEKLKGNGAPT